MTGECFCFCVWRASSRGLVGAGGSGEYGIGHVCLERSRQRQKINMEEHCFLLSSTFRSPTVRRVQNANHQSLELLDHPEFHFHWMKLKLLVTIACKVPRMEEKELIFCVRTNFLAILGLKIFHPGLTKSMLNSSGFHLP